MKATVEKIIYPGKSLCRAGGKIILTDSGLPDEEIEISPIKERKSYIEAETIKILRPSPHRKEPACGHYRICSPYQYIDYPFQIKIKQAQLEEILFYQLKIKLSDIGFCPSSQIYNYRNKIQFQIIWRDKKPCLGYNLPGRYNQFLAIDNCSLGSMQANRLLALLLDIIAKYNLSYIKAACVKRSFSKNQMLLILFCENIKNSEDLFPYTDQIKKEFPVKGIVCMHKKTLRQKTIWGDNFIEEKINEKIFYAGADSFFQINTPMIERVAKDIKKFIPFSGSAIIADLYCGVGTFGIMFAKDVRQVIGIESSKENIFFLKRNIQVNNIGNFIIHQQDCANWIREIPQGSVDVLIIDPPRAGMSKAFCEHILKKSPAYIGYVSCDPSTMARDLKILLSAYKLKHISGYDFFPHTPHIETLCILEK